MEHRDETIEQLALDTLTLARNTLLVNLRFLDMALNLPKYTSVPGIRAIATDGKHLFYDPRFVLSRFKKERGRVARDYLHTVLHCVFRHMFVGDGVNRRLWDLACDIAVEHTVMECKIASLHVAEEALQREESAALLSEIGGLTAERIYRFLLETPLPELHLQSLECLFAADLHDVWYDRQKYAAFTGICDEKDVALTEWMRVSERMQEALECFFSQRGDAPGNMIQNLREVNRERYDYSAFLKRFAVPAEVMRVNDDEFDYVYYTYGLAQYKNLPLVEPLEYKDEKRIKEFVIAIDTSGSVSGELVQSFVQKTYNILKSTESFSSRINLHIIQCDAEIQEDVKIERREQLDAYIERMQIRGLGGTDFRPVFSYVEELCARGEFSDLKGLLYFTDGYGVFPERMPPYATAFVFIDEGYNNLDVPPWAIKLILRKDEI